MAGPDTFPTYIPLLGRSLLLSSTSSQSVPTVVNTHTLLPHITLPNLLVLESIYNARILSPKTLVTLTLILEQ